MASIHPTAILQGDVTLAEDVEVGPHCVLDAAGGPIAIGAGCRFRGSAYLNGPLTLGQGNLVYPFVTLGFAPQDFKWKIDESGAGLRIGSGNTFRESVTIHRATSHSEPTTIGDRNFFMTGSHVGHDGHVGNHCVFANAVALGGHVRVDDRVNIGGASVVHQFVRLGRGAMLTGGMGTSLDVPPYFMLTGFNITGSVNLIGLRRSGATPEQIESVRWAYKVLCRQGLSIKSAIEVLRERADDPTVAEYIDFVSNSKRGICTTRGRAARGTA